MMLLIFLCIEWDISPGYCQAAGLHLCHRCAETGYRGVGLHGEQHIMHGSHGYTNTQRSILETP